MTQSEEMELQKCSPSWAGVDASPLLTLLYVPNGTVVQDCVTTGSFQEMGIARDQWYRLKTVGQKCLYLQVCWKELEVCSYMVQ